jgi:hypothetical protein
MSVAKCTDWKKSILGTKYTHFICSKTPTLMTWSTKSYYVYKKNVNGFLNIQISFC